MDATGPTGPTAATTYGTSFTTTAYLVDASTDSFTLLLQLLL